MIVTITGRAGAGKSTVARELSARLGFCYVSAGGFMREIAEKRGLSLLELSRLAEKDDAIDREIDARSTRLSATGESFVVDSRLAWYFIPQSVKMFLDVRMNVAAQRVYAAERMLEPENVDLETTMQSVQERARSERLRYQTYYGINYLEMSNYDLVIDTSDLSIDVVLDQIAAYLECRT